MKTKINVGDTVVADGIVGEVKHILGEWLHFADWRKVLWATRIDDARKIELANEERTEKLRDTIPAGARW